MWEHGLLVHVPTGVEVEKPMYLRIANTVDGGSLFWRMLIVAEAQSRFTLIEEFASASPGSSGYSNAAVEIVVQDGAKVEYVSVQNLSQQHLALRLAPRDASSATPSSTGSRAVSARAAARCGSRTTSPARERPHGSPAPTSPTASSGSTTTPSRSTSRRNTTSDFAFKGVLRDTASAVWRGMIRVEEGAQKTNAYQENRNLLLSKTAHADSIPGLEILANDVRCTHGATLSQVDREQLFYAMARGLSRQEAERLIVRGFFQDVLDRIELEPVREALGAGARGPHPE